MRISLVGGGSDYLSHFKNYGGSVLGLAINSFVYVTAHDLPPISKEKFRFTYRKTESVLDHKDFEHPVIREALGHLSWNRPMNFSTFADLPGNSGLGSSSAFTVALLKALHLIRMEEVSDHDLAIEAIHIERELLNEAGGIQDQLICAYGGLNRFDFRADSSISVKPICGNPSTIDFLVNHLMLLPIGGHRQSSSFAELFNLEVKKPGVWKIADDMAKASIRASKLLESNKSPQDIIGELAEIIDLGWRLKCLSNPNADLELAASMISAAQEKGALAGKLCGAGGSGYILLVCPPEIQAKLAWEMKIENWFNPLISENGVQVANLVFDEDLSPIKWHSYR
jgi:D-glycero-alpha-D-manno-heptose-7-phosphate kinase